MRSSRLLIAVVIALIGGLFYFCNTQENPVTGEKQRVALSTEQEIALGLQTAPQMAAEFGGLHPDPVVQDYVE
ncbi:MAG: M48 family peptidase, partial [Thermoanaerobaculia bacterium]|nr:M48 family peptidase [Thermoanaerobaculia bacterium]